MKRRALLLIAVLALPACQCLRDHYDLWFVVPKNPFPSSTSNPAP